MKIIFVLIAILIIAAGVYAFKKWKAKRKIVPHAAAPAPVYATEPTPAVATQALTEAELIAADSRWDLTRPVTPRVAPDHQTVEPTHPPLAPSPTSEADLIALDSRWDMTRPRDNTPAAEPAPVVLTEAELIEVILRSDRETP